ncbi:type IVB secretion system protein IcmH/DotU [Rubrimonas cliftonensis]|uniref:Type VI secretion system protein ImpK n=1 Tax=Rubrimonas cliftonensis TaxID=89524 RepID=A0A1H4BG64_9RHOB|nr:type IVB secretion system protein IcmH/DotU [Rubrimonas cliftonensis]SEA47121.1 type VI secretion system protein ImpK [Rubrimonas cliftonensis]
MTPADAPKDPRSIPATVVAPNPGGRLAGAPPGVWGGAPAAGAAPAGLGGARRGPVGVEPGEARPGVNPLVDAAADLFDLLVYLRGQATALDVDTLRMKSMALIRQFDLRADAEGVDQGVAQVARYAIAATIDDEIMSKPWGMEAGWQNATLVASLYEEVIGGDRFFELLDEAVAEPRRFGDLVELMHICLSLGFKGRYRRGGAAAEAELEQWRRRAFDAVTLRRDGFTEALSLHWRGVDTERRPLRELAPIWLIASLSAAACAGLFFLAAWLTGGEAARSAQAAVNLPPQLGPGQSVEIVRLAAPAPREEVVLAPPRLDRVRGFLDAEIKEGLVEVFEEAGLVRIRLLGAGMFAGGKAVVLPRYQNVLLRVADALNDEPGDVIIEGHTDSVPIRTAQFPDNVALSLARATAAADFVRPLLSAPDRIEIKALAATKPIADNATREGRARNRRVELVLDRGGAAETAATQ